ncbi:MAG: isoprenylcysteine carboxylmethyltransferase family protein [Anaerolineales bacterium]|nr:isoprenylcysteine carboxylmethyltransferase family protein [Anaerolineales bacterium]
MMILNGIRWLAFAASLSLLLVYFRGGTTLVRDVRRSVESAGDYFYLALSLVMGTAGLVILATQLLICAGLVRPSAAVPDWIAAAGGVVSVGSILLSYWIRSRLGRYWSGNVEVKPGHRIVDTGPYRVVRHPLYANTLILYPAAALAFAVWWVWLACGIMTAGYALLAGYEDRFLLRNLTGYAEYRKRTVWRLIPWIW